MGSEMCIRDRSNGEQSKEGVSLGRGGKQRGSDQLSTLVCFLFHRRNVATVLVQRGVLKKGTILLAGQSVARVNDQVNISATVHRSALGSSVVQRTWRAN